MMQSIDKPLDAKDTRKQALAFLKIPVIKHDLSLRGSKEPLERFQAVVRQDTGAVLSVVSPGYQLMGHDEVLADLLTFLKDGGWTLEKARLERDGAHAFVVCYNPNINLLGKEEKVHPRLVLVHGMDLRTGLRIMFGAYRWVCSNGLVVPDSRYEALKLSTTHAGDISGRLVGFSSKLADALKVLQTVGPMYRSLVNSKVDKETAEQLLSKVAGKRNSERVLQLWEQAPGQPKPHDTAWGLYNGLTYWLTHEAAGGLYARDLKSRQLLTALLNRPGMDKSLKA